MIARVYILTNHTFVDNEIALEIGQANLPFSYTTLAFQLP